ncbi:hypothetical protein FQN60_018469, partial [Etheostoma spectabile]
MYHHR